MKFWSVLIAIALFSFTTQAEVSFEAGVNVEAEADNAVLAKDIAMKKANREAFLKVAERLTTKDNVQKLNELTDEQLLHFILEVAVVAEKSGLKSYRADLNIGVNGNLLKQYMQENGMLEVVSAPAQILIVPVYSDTEYTDKVLWEDGNIWRSAWQDKGIIMSGALDFKIIDDNAPNRAAINVSSVLNMDKDTYDKISFLNGTKNVFVVNAVRAGRNNLVIIIKSFPKVEEKRFIISDESGETLDKAIAQTVGYISSLVQTQDVQESQNQGQVSAVFYYFRIKEWLEMEKKIKTIPQIKKVETTALGGGKVQLTLMFSGSEERLISSMEKNGLYLQAEKNFYILK